ncbi:recombinase family protein [Vibrio kyushuensis]|uniref:YlcI/YnfO family protein n=1 Tax=Vibrio kyushuensis TaxID=2910249 RepID=UPI003D148907
MDKKYIVLNSNTNRNSSKKNIRFEHEIIEQIERLKGDRESFSRWVKQACMLRIQYETIEGRSVRTPSLDPVRTSITSRDDIVSTVRELSEKGLFHQQIADTLNERGIGSPNGKPWNRRMVSVLLK